MKNIILLLSLFVLPTLVANAKDERADKRFNTLDMAINSYCLDTKERVDNAAIAADICYEQANQLHSELISRINLSKNGGKNISQSTAQDVFNTEMMIRQSVDHLRTIKIQP